MKKIFTITLFICAFINLKGQSNTQKTIIISKITSGKKIARQISFKLNNNGIISFRRKTNRHFKIKKAKSLFFTDSCEFGRLKEICTSNFNDSIENICEYHYEKGYFKIEVIKENYKAIYSESFIIHVPYRCIRKEDELYIKKVMDEINKFI